MASNLESLKSATMVRVCIEGWPHEQQEIVARMFAVFCRHLHKVHDMFHARSPAFALSGVHRIRSTFCLPNGTWT